MKRFRGMAAVILAACVAMLLAACSDDSGDSDPDMIARFIGANDYGNTDRIDIFDDNTWQYFIIDGGEYVMIAKGTYAGDPNDAGTVVIRMSAYWHDGEWLSAPKSLGPCNVLLSKTVETYNTYKITIDNWADVVRWGHGVRG